jgi:ABC-type transport system substrate-binding protein
LEESPLIPLFHLVSRTLVKPRVRGFHPNPLEWMNAATLEVTRR